MDKWFNVNKDIRVWSGHSDNAQKKGKIFAPAGLFAIDEYKGSVEFKPEDLKFDGDGRFERDGTEKKDAAYPGFWVRLDELSVVPFDLDDDEPVGPGDPLPGDPSPVPPQPVGEPSDEEVGRVVKFLLSLL